MIRAAHTAGFATGEEGSNEFAPSCYLTQRVLPQVRKSLLPRLLWPQARIPLLGATTGGLGWLVSCLLVNLTLLARQLPQPAGYGRVISANPGFITC